MKSYASIDRIEGKFAVCEVELISIEERNVEEYVPYDTEFMDISLKNIPADFGKVRDGDILVVEHNGENITSIYYKDDMETCDFYDYHLHKASVSKRKVFYYTWEQINLIFDVVVPSELKIKDFVLKDKINEICKEIDSRYVAVITGLVSSPGLKY